MLPRVLRRLITQLASCILRGVFEIGVESGARYDNPARFVKRVGERPKKLELPEFDKFVSFVDAIENAGSGFSKPCAEFVRFLSFGGFRKLEAAFITWADCDFTKGKIIVRGDPETGTKNGEFREVPMIPDMRQMLEAMQAQRPMNLRRSAWFAFGSAKRRWTARPKRSA